MTAHEIIPYVLALLQWARSRTRFKEIFYIGIVFSASFVLYATSESHPFGHSWQYIVAGIWKPMMTILAATQVVSSVTNVAVDTGVVNKDHAFVPATSSK